MGMSTRVTGYVSRDKKWEQYEKIYRACEEAAIKPPDEVQEFFGWSCPYDRPGRAVDIEQAVEPYESDGCSGFTVNLSEIPDEVTVIRFYNSW